MDNNRREIKHLSPEVIRLIAAGEVIERPMSVVKELIENSLDAGARQIEVRLINGGLTSITVRDDGAGIPLAEIPLLLERHTTSKIGSEDDLGNILTLGFRGEALYSISSVSEMILSTRFSDEEIGTRLMSSGGERNVEEISWPGGTQVESIGLFASTPARRKFLRGSSAEYARVAGSLAYCLAYPEVAFRLSHDGRETLRTHGNGNAEDALLAVFGAEVARQMLQVSHQENKVVVRGSISGYNTTRARRTDQFIFLNGRLIKDPSISAAFERAYDPFLAPGRHPIAVISVECEGAEVDVNVHPHKKEVRFAHPGLVAGAVNRAAKLALAKSYVSESVDAGKQETTIDETTGEVLSRERPAPRGLMPSWSSIREDRNWEIWEPKHRHTGDWIEPDQTPIYREKPSAKTSEPDVQHVYPSFDEIGLEDLLDVSGNTLHFADTYIIYNRGRTVYLIDQHNLHERILYEGFQKRRQSEEVLTQALLFPLQVRLTPGLAGLVQAHQDDLKALGFDIEEFSGGAGGAFVLRGVPSELKSDDPSRVLTDCLERVSQDEAISEPGGFQRAFDTNLACKSAIKAGRPLTEEEIEFLISHIGDGTFYTCPHGRPAVIKLDEEWFRRIFKR